MPVRFTKPLVSILEHLPLSAAAATILAFLDAALGLFVTQAEYLALILILVAIDLLTGLIRSVKRGDPVVSRKLRRTTTKVLEYLLIGATAVVIKAALDVEGGPSLLISLVEHLDVYVLAVIAFTELWSILENVTGKGPRRVAGYLSQIFTLWSTKNNFPPHNNGIRDEDNGRENE